MKATACFLICSLFVFFATGLSAQTSQPAQKAQKTYKFAHINSQDLLGMMPESDSAQATLQRLQQTYSDQFDEMQVEFNKKYQTYLEKRDTYTALIRQTKESELTEMQTRIDQFQQTAAQDMQQKRSDLLAPILNKANKAIKEVAEDNGYIYVFDVSQGNPVYFSDQSIDIMPLVKEKLGL